MVKLLIAGIWALAIALSSLYGVVVMNSEANPVASEDKFFGGLDYVKSEIISVPILDGGKIDGYVVAQFVFTIEEKVSKRLSIPPAMLIIDEAFSTLFSKKYINFRDIKPFALDEMKEHIRANVNKRFGSDLIHEVLVEQLNFIPMDQVRYGPRRRGKSK